MKTKINLLAFGTVLFLFESPLFAQIGENEYSVSVIAMQCAVSSGYSASDFDDYSRRLAKTLSLLSPDQQKRVFGYLPQLNDAMKVKKGGSNALPTASGPILASGSEAPKTETPGAPAAAPAPADGPMDGLVALVGNFNKAISGSNSTPSSPVYAGADFNEVAHTPVAGNQIAAASSGGLTEDPPTKVPGRDTLAAASLPSATDASGQERAASGATKPSSWDALLSWFKAAENAYNSGTLKDFIQTQPKE